jgi:hypothetical protein
MRGKRSGQPASLWELMNKDSLRQSQEKVIEQFTKDNVDPSSVKTEKPPIPVPVKVPVAGFSAAKSRKKPLIGYKGLAVIALIVIVIIVIAFNRSPNEPDGGPSGNLANREDTDNGSSGEERAVIAPPYRTVKVENREIEKELEEKAVAAEKANDHLVIITVYQVKRDLEPVVAHFRGNGIITEIVKPNNSKFYYLVSKKKYQSPERKGTDGYYALANIKRVGAKYSAPKGYEPFGRTPFQDAYGVNFKKSSIFKNMF